MVAVISHSNTVNKPDSKIPQKLAKRDTWCKVVVAVAVTAVTQIQLTQESKGKMKEEEAC